MAYIEIYERYSVIPRLYEFLQKVHSLVFRNYDSIIESNQERQEIRIDLRKKKAFLTLKEILTKKPILAMFNPAKKIIVKTDTSKIALDSILNQPDKEKRLHPITFHSRKFTAPELNYDIHDKELSAIVNSFKI